MSTQNGLLSSRHLSLSLQSRNFGKSLAKRNKARIEEAIKNEHLVIDIGLVAHLLRPGKVFLQRGLRSLVYPLHSPASAQYIPLAGQVIKHATVSILGGYCPQLRAISDAECELLRPSMY